jgi:hypothetical protein
LSKLNKASLCTSTVYWYVKSAGNKNMHYT